MKNPIDNLKQNISRMTAMQKSVADYIIRNYVDVAFSTIDQVASAVGTSTTTIMRLMAVAGYSGYSEFQKQLQELVREQMSPKSRLEYNLKTIDKENFWEKCYQRELSNITETMEAIPLEVLDDIVSHVASARNIYLVAARGGIMVAQFLHLFLSRMFGNSTLIEADLCAQWSTYIPGADATDLAIVFSYPRYSKGPLAFADAIKRQKAFVVGVTDSYTAPLAQRADIVLPCKCSSIGFHNSAVSAMFIADCIINVATLRYSARIKPRLESSAKLLEEMEYYIH